MSEYPFDEASAHLIRRHQRHVAGRGAEVEHDRAAADSGAYGSRMGVDVAHPYYDPFGKSERLCPRGRDRPRSVVARAVRLADVAHDG